MNRARPLGLRWTNELPAEQLTYDKLWESIEAYERVTGINSYVPGTGGLISMTQQQLADFQKLQQQYMLQAQQNAQLLQNQQMIYNPTFSTTNMTATTNADPTFQWSTSPGAMPVNVPSDELCEKLPRIRGLFFFPNMNHDPTSVEKSPKNPKYWTVHDWHEVGDECKRCGIMVSVPDDGLGATCPITNEEAEIYDKWQAFNRGYNYLERPPYPSEWVQVYNDPRSSSTVYTNGSSSTASTTTTYTPPTFNPHAVGRASYDWTIFGTGKGKHFGWGNRK